MSDRQILDQGDSGSSAGDRTILDTSFGYRQQVTEYLGNQNFAAQVADRNDSVNAIHSLFPHLDRNEVVDNFPQMFEALTGKKHIDGMYTLDTLANTATTYYNASRSNALRLQIDDLERRPKAQGLDKGQDLANSVLLKNAKEELAALGSSKVEQMPSRNLWDSAVQGFVSLAGSKVSQVMAAGAGFAVAGVPGAITGAFGAGVSATEADFYGAMKEKGVPYEIARPSSFFWSLPIAAIDAAGFTGSVAAVLKPIVLSAAKAALPQVAQLGLRASVMGLKALEGAAIEAGTETVQELVQSTGEDITTSFAMWKQFGPAEQVKLVRLQAAGMKDAIAAEIKAHNLSSGLQVQAPEEVAQRLTDTAVQTFLGTLLMGGVGGAVYHGTRAALKAGDKVKKAQDDRTLAKHIVEVGKDSQTAQAIAAAPMVADSHPMKTAVVGPAGEAITVYHPVSQEVPDGNGVAFYTDRNDAEAQAQGQSTGPLEPNAFLGALRTNYPGVVADAAQAVIQHGRDAAAPFADQLKAWDEQNPTMDHKQLLDLALSIHDGSVRDNRNEVLVQYGLQSALPSGGIVEAKIQADQVAHVDSEDQIAQAFKDGAQAVEFAGVWRVKDAQHILKTGMSDSRVQAATKNPVGQLSFQANDGTTRALTGKGTEAGRLKTEVSGDTVHIHELSTTPEFQRQGVARALVTRLMEQHPGKTIVWPKATTADGKKFQQQVRMGLPTWKAWGSRIQQAERAGKVQQAEYFRQKADTVPDPAALLGDRQLSRDQVLSVLAKGMNVNEAEAALAIIDRMAEAAGTNLEGLLNMAVAGNRFHGFQWVQGVRDDKGVLRESANGATTLGSGGVRLIQLVQGKANVSTVLHEMAHVVRPLLAAEDQAALLSWTGEKTWNRAAEEFFARGFEQYLGEGHKTGDGKIDAILEKLAGWLRMIYDALFDNPVFTVDGRPVSLTPEVRASYQKILGGKRTTESPGFGAPVNEADMPLFQDTEEVAAVRAKYEGTPTYGLAPNGQKSNLSERQWLHVRTPSFKRWFGDWEAAALESSMVRARGSDQARTAVDAFIGQELVNQETGLRATVSGGSFGEMVAEKARKGSVSPQAHYQAVANVDKLFAIAVRDGIRKGKKPGDENVIQNVHHFIAPMPFDGEVLKVSLLVKEFVKKEDGARIYFLHAVEIENAGVVGGEPVVSGNLQHGNDPASSPPPDVALVFSRLVQSVKGDAVSKVVDANGEPQVVHHGTAKEFEAFDRSKLSEGQRGFFFTPNKTEAGYYGRRREFFLSVRNPTVYDKGTTTNGTDGEYFTAATKMEAWVAYKPTQIKSATDNVGTYDPENPSTLFQDDDLYVPQSSEDAEAYARSIDGRGRTTNASDGRVAMISNRDIAKMASESAQKKSVSPLVHNIAVANVKALFERSYKGWFKPDRDQSPDVSGVYRYFTDLHHGGEKFIVKLTVKELVHPQGNRVYSVEAMDIKKGSDGLLADATADGIDLRTAPLSEHIVNLLRPDTDVNDGTLFQEAWHGSPHRFDRFDSSHMGSGEGAQAFGWGHYFAGKKDLAEWYHQKLTDGGHTWLMDGKPVVNGDIQSAKGLALEMLTGAQTVDKAVTRLADISGEKWIAARVTQQQADEAAKYLEANRDRFAPKVDGNVYKVDIPDDSEMLDWDKAIGAQSKTVLTVLHEMADIYPMLKEMLQPLEVGATTGASVYHFLTRELGSANRASRDLAAAGIPGIRYLDGLSRTAGEGDHNYVVFEDSQVSILETLYQEDAGQAADILESGKSATVESAKLGQVTIDLGSEGTLAKRWKDGNGLLHIIARRTAEGGSATEVAKTIAAVIEAVKTGEIAREYGGDKGRADLERNGYTAVVSKVRHGAEERWLLTGFKNWSSDEVGESYNPDLYTPGPSGSRAQVVAELKSMVSRDSATVKPGNNEKGPEWFQSIGLQSPKEETLKASNERLSLKSEVVKQSPATLFQDDDTRAVESALAEKEHDLAVFRQGRDKYLANRAAGKTQAERDELAKVVDEFIANTEKQLAADRAALATYQANTGRPGARKLAIQQAVAAGRAVPDAWIEEFGNEPWAKAELDRRADLRDQLEFARGFDDVDSYVSALIEDRVLQAMGDPFESTLTAEEWDAAEAKARDEASAIDPTEWERLQQVFAIAHAKTPEQLDKEFAASLSADKVKQILVGMREGGYVADKNLPRFVTAQVTKSREGVQNNVNEDEIPRILKAMQNDPRTYRRIAQQGYQDMAELEALALEQQIDAAARDQAADEAPPVIKPIEIPSEMSFEDKMAIRVGTASRMEWQRKAMEADKESQHLDRALTLVENLSRSWTQQGQKVQTGDSELADLTAVAELAQAQNAKLRGLLRELAAEAGNPDSKTKDRLVKLLVELTAQIRSELKTRDAARRAYAAQAEEMRKMGNYLARVAPKTLRIDYQKKINENRALIDPHFRTSTKLEMLKLEAEWYKAHPDVPVPRVRRGELYGKNLNLWSYDELHAAYQERLALEEAGRNAMRVKTFGILERRYAIKQKVLSALYNKQAQFKASIDSAPDDEERARRAERYLKWEMDRAARVRNLTDEKASLVAGGGSSYFLTTSNLADSLDGMADFKGINHQTLYTDVNSAENAKLAHTDRRKVKFFQWIKDYRGKDGSKIQLGDLKQQIKIEGVEVAYTPDALMSVYVGQKNEMKAMALRFGNRIDQKVFDFINSAPQLQWVRDLGNRIIQEYGENAERLFDVAEEYDNIDLRGQKQDNYTPMSRRDVNSEGMEVQLSYEAGVAAAVRSANIEHGFTEARVKIGEDHQKPIKLGEFDQWLQMVERQETYIAYTPVVKDLKAIYTSNDVREAITETHGRRTWQEIDHYVKSLANRYHDKSFTALDRLMSKLSGNAALAFMAYNLATTLKQLSSLPLFLAHTRTDLLVASFAKLVNPVALFKKVDALSVQIRTRIGYDELTALRLGGNAMMASPKDGKLVRAVRVAAHEGEKLMHKVADPGMKPMQWMDKLVAVAGWDAAYETALAKNATQEAAIEYADWVVGKTQQSTHAKDTAGVMRDNNSLVKAMTLFAGPGVKVYNEVFYGIRANLKNGHSLKAAGTLLGVSASAIIFYGIAKGAPPEGEEWYQWIFLGLMNQIPVAGPAVTSVLQGYDSGNIVLNQALDSAVKTGKSLTVALDAAESQTKRDAAWPKVARGALDIAGLGLGAPVSPIKRVWTAFETGNPGELVGWHEPKK